MTLVTILLMAMITFLSRYLLIHPRVPLKLGAKMVNFLSFSAPAVLTAIWVPIVFIENGQLNTQLSNPYLLASSVAIVIAWKTHNIYWTLVVSLFVFVGLQLL
ncbi:branched-chain amino acid ABC transporter [Thalassotalea insulae]|uniref:Branched-chain amino acid ABC transporter n=1 Tax=Thalassotalea insulae TaxID=2056778 RepID=A0ABQ6H0P2_9GAMM|nr:AzlD domain-containing protein [Thalassotalea insulae]GLX80001.1 branched-chain amino acid ABC transporter [Thalassotalea insulae]